MTALLVAIPLAVPVQLFCTWVQFAFARRKRSRQYRVALLFSTGLSLFSYQTPMADLFVPRIWLVPLVWVLTAMVAIIIDIVVLGADIIPEHLAIQE